jgi:secretory phospholipase A2
MKILNFMCILMLLISVYSSKFSCPDGKSIIQVIQPTSNGCGPELKNGFAQALNKIGKALLDKFQECCNHHDICYGTCGNDRNTCDSDFKQCMKKECNGNKVKKFICNKEADALYGIVDKFGEKIFTPAQDKKCKCS